MTILFCLLAFLAGYIMDHEKRCNDEDYMELSLESRWIPVSCKTPEEGERVLVSDVDDKIFIARFNNGKFILSKYCEIEIDIAAWIPLPTPYIEYKSKNN